MRVLLLSAYDALSHQRWRKELVQALPEIDWRVLSLPARHFSWRFRGNAMTWHRHTALTENFDAILATSMVDIATLKGLVPALATVPVVLYFHENQFAFPEEEKSFTSLDIQLSSLYGAIAADRLVFNSCWNRDSFIAGVEQLLDKLPDATEQGLVAELQEKSAVLAVPLRDELFEPGPGGSSAMVTESYARQQLQSQSQSGKLRIVWNHRWEHDKAPDRLLAFTHALLATGKAFELHVLGQQFRRRPAEFAQLQQLFEHAASATLGHFGFMESTSDYHALLRSSDIVLSTALQDFQGLAVMEAVAMGCRPLLPRRLAYPEFFPDACLYDCYPGDPEREARGAVDKLLGESCLATPALLHRLRWSKLRGEYQSMLNSLPEKC